ncbi:hypothetical protein [Phaeodactylibacter luteus]|uniref:Uncharacterized protein n=1 Tax=Phaeodactylibacter luteus TaxID=1564516 RepID=A0A5C6RJY1_9BACT|nr:hypothetical protein [Phaeodactylibacter luteus]TXB62661.1 hypothetical protein FRY97_13045 [Phaeodactylibacter luteus]
MENHAAFSIEATKDDDAALMLAVIDEHGKVLWEITGAYATPGIYKAWKRLPWIIRAFLTLIVFIFGGEIELGGGAPRQIKRWVLTDASGREAAVYQRVHRGVKAFHGKKLIGKMMFKSRKFICDYDVEFQGRALGKVVPLGIAHQKFEIRDGTEVVGRAEKLHYGQPGRKDMQLRLSQRHFAAADMPGLLGIILL